MIRFGGSYGSASSSPSYYDFLAGTANSALPTGVTLTRASSATRRNSSGNIETISTDVPAWQYSTTGTARGLRIFGAATNQVMQSKALTGTNASNLFVRCSLTAGATTSPDGTANAGKLVEDTTASNSHYTYINNMSVTTSTLYTASIYAKAAERSWIFINFLQTNGFVATSGGAYFDLGTGVTGTVDAGFTAGIEDAGSGWYRCWISAASAATTADARAGFSLATGNLTSSYTGDGASGAYLWGAQFEAGAGPTSFIPTTTAAATRAADTGLITSGYPLVDQTWVIRARTPLALPNTTHALFSVDDGTSSNRRHVWRDSAGTLFAGQTVSGSGYLVDLGVVANDTDFTIACRFADNNLAASLNGAAIVKNTSCVNPLGLTTARVGQYVNGSGYHWNSTIRSIETRRTASDTELPLLCA